MVTSWGGGLGFDVSDYRSFFYQDWFQPRFWPKGHLPLIDTPLDLTIINIKIQFINKIVDISYSL